MRFFQEADDAMVAVDIDHAKFLAFGRIGEQGGDGGGGSGVLVLLKHAPVIHFVDVVAGENDDVLRLLASDGINVLIQEQL